MDTLFELIKSLTKSEKVHFKKYISMHSYKTKSPQLLLYELIEKSSGFDEKKYKKKIGEKKYALTKFTLYDLIQKALRDFHEKGTDLAKMLNYLQSIEIMIAKNLISQAETLNLKAKKLALENEDYFMLCKILQNELKFLTAPKKVPKDVSKHQEAYEAFEKSIQQIDQLGKTLLHLSQIIIPVRQTFNVKNELHKQIVENAKNDINHLISIKDSSIWVKLNCYRIQGVLASFEGDIEENIAANLKIVSFLESKPSFLINNPRGLIGAYRNLFGASIQGKKWNLSEEIIQKLQNYLDQKSIINNKKVSAYILETYLSAAGYLFAIKPIIDNDYLENLKLYNQNLAIHKSLINNLREDSLVITNYYQGVISFRLKNYEQCLQHINRYKIQKRDTNRFKRIEAAILILQLISLYEIEEVEVAESLLRSIKRAENVYLENNIFIKESLSFVKNALKFQVNKISNDIKESKPVNELDNALSEWIVSKI